jgi:chemotaxis protein MotB
MSRKKKQDGAPAYMQLFTTLMILLLAFFIVLSTMTEEQESGFRSGIGDVKDAFGTVGGLGLLSYDLFRVSQKAVPIPRDAARDTGAVGVHRSLVEGSGGGGNSEANAEKQVRPAYLRVPIPFSFDPGSDILPVEMANYLDVTGTGFAVFDVQLTVRSSSTEAGRVSDEDLALRRALAIVRYLHRSCGVPFERMQAVGYGSSRYLKTVDEAAPGTGPDQEHYFYVARRG